MRKEDMKMVKKGMNRSSHPSELSEQEYSLALNANIQGENEGQQFIIQNENSNILCSKFIEGFVVVKAHYDVVRERTYFFLTNEQTGCSEIGFIRVNNAIIDGNEVIEANCNCDVIAVMEEGLENITEYEATCEYETLISDFCELTGECTSCLGFSVLNPVTDVVIRHSTLGDELYFTNGKNPQMMINVDNIESYFTDKDPCTGEVKETCLDCEKLRVFRLFDHPCMKAEGVHSGGSLKAGTYEAFLFYSESDGELISDVMASTNRISIYDINNNIKDQTNADERTDLAFSLSIEGLDDDYEFYTIVIAYTSENNPSRKFSVYGTFSTQENKVIVSNVTEGAVERVSEGDVLAVRPIYESAEGLTTAGGYLFQHGLKRKADINIQPIANLMGAFVKWQTIKTREDFYRFGDNVANYRTYMRDETYPLSLNIGFKGGYKTPLGVLIARPPTAYELQPIEDNNTRSITEANIDCGDTIRTARWQFENTATNEGSCSGGSGDEIEEEYTETLTCYSAPYIIEDGQFNVDTTESILQYINTHQTEILASTEPWLQPIKDALLFEYEECKTEPSGDCNNGVIVSNTISAVSVGIEETVDTSIPLSEYLRTPSPLECNNVETDDGTGDRIEDTSITSLLPSGYEVWKKTPVTNTSCTSAEEASLFVNASTNVAGSYHLVDMASTITMAPLLTSTTTSLFNGVDFQNKLHKNVIWFKVTFTGNPNILVDLTQVSCTSGDDNTNNKVRATVWSGCPSLVERPSYGRYINDVTTLSTESLILLNGADFPSGVAYIAVDSPMDTWVTFDVTFKGEGKGDFEIGGNSYSIEVSTPVSTSIVNFITTYGTSMVSNGIYPEAVGDVLRLRMRNELFQTIDFISDSVDVTYSNYKYDYFLQPPCGCFSVSKRDAEMTTAIRYENLQFVNTIVREYSCVRFVDNLNTDCEPSPHEIGKFSYIESMEKYPCNEELYDSSKLKVDSTTIPDSIKTDFENYYTNGIDQDGYYILTNEADFRDKNIRHFKFPDNKISPFMGAQSTDSSIIYPIGVNLNPEIINFFLDVAVTNGLMTQEDRDNATTFEVFRGDRRIHRSIISKGIAFTALEYIDEKGSLKQENKILYPNYPLNDLTADTLNDGLGKANFNFLTYHSPDSHFVKPTLTNEIKIDGYLRGKATTTFAPMKDHPTYVILGRRARTLATALAGLEATAEILAQVADLVVNAATASIGIIGAAALAVAQGVVLVTTSLFKYGTYRYQWLTTFEGLNQGYNHAYIGLSEGRYNDFVINNVASSQYRGLDISSYLLQGDVAVRDERMLKSHRVNNFERERSVLLKTTEGYPIQYPSDLVGYDRTRKQVITSSVGTHKIDNANTTVPYVTMKQYLPNQWGQVHSIDWLPTNYCGRLDSNKNCEAIFGGDVFISRLYIKKKFPFFRETAHRLAPNIPFKYSSQFNIRQATGTKYIPTAYRGFIDYKTDNDTLSFGGQIFPENKTAYTLYDMYGSRSSNTSEINDFYVSDEYKFLTQYYGVPSFLVESEINCNFRYGRFELRDNFIPYVPNLIDWVQESNVPMSEEESFFYDYVHSGAPMRKPWSLLPRKYSKESYDKLNDLTNTVIYSSKDDMTNSLRAPWRNYRALDYVNFSREHGTLIDIVGIESEILWLRFTDGYALYNVIDPIREKVDPTNMGIGHLFQERAMNFNKTDLGYGGTQHKVKISTPFGHYSVDAKRGKVFELAPNAKGLKEISNSMDKWFKEQLPFKLTKYIPNADVDNAYNGAGIVMGWDDTYKRLFITKLDYIPKHKGETFYDENGYYVTINNSRLYVKLEDEDYFEKASWTIAYSPLTESWISYYSFTPNYFIGYNNYFQTGVNNLESSKHGLWSHYDFISSYQVFYGELHPFIIEYSLPTKGSRSFVEDVSYWLETRKYYRKYDFANIFGKSFNKSYLYNDYQSTGLLELVPQDTNDKRQRLMFPLYTNESTQILTSEMDNKWSFNTIYNAVKNERSGMPLFVNDNVNILKYPNNELLDLTSRRKDRLRGDWQLVQLIQDADSRFKYLFRIQNDTRNYYD